MFSFGRITICLNSGFAFVNYYGNLKTAVISIQVFGFHSLKPCAIKTPLCWAPGMPPLVPGGGMVRGAFIAATSTPFLLLQVIKNAF